MLKPVFNECSIVVPSGPEGSDFLKSLGVLDKSALVSREKDCGTVAIYYEGNLHGATNLEDPFERIYTAAGRLLYKAPTIAFCVLAKEKFDALFLSVGSVTFVNSKMSCNIASPERFNSWSA